MGTPPSARGPQQTPGSDTVTAMAAPSRRSARRSGSAAVAAALASSLLLASCELPRFGAPDPGSEEGGHVLGLWQGFFLAAIAVTLTVWVPLVFVLVRYRRRKGDQVPSQRAYNIPLELALAAGPLLIVAVLFFSSVRVQPKITDVSADPVARVEVIGFQWGWQFRYLGEGFTVDAPPGEVPQMVLPIGVETNLELVATDVAHAFWVPDFLSKRDLIPGVDNELTVTPTELGTFVGRCAEFCGLDHWRMHFSVKVVSMDDYRAWLDEQRAAGGGAPAATPDEPASSSGVDRSDEGAVDPDQEGGR
jgi:cytochrome c oxidase subunit 2